MADPCGDQETKSAQHRPEELREFSFQSLSTSLGVPHRPWHAIVSLVFCIWHLKGGKLPWATAEKDSHAILQKAHWLQKTTLDPVGVCVEASTAP